MKDICLWSHIALNNSINISMNSFLLPPPVYKFIQHPDKPALPQNLNINIRLKPKQLLTKYDNMFSQLQILWHSIPTYRSSYLKLVTPETKTYNKN